MIFITDWEQDLHDFWRLEKSHQAMFIFVEVVWKIFEEFDRDNNRDFKQMTPKSTRGMLDIFFMTFCWISMWASLFQLRTLIEEQCYQTRANFIKQGLFENA